MPRLNPFSLKRIPRVVETRTFTDADHPGVEWELTLREPDALELSGSNDLALEMIDRYVEGDGEAPAFPFVLDNTEYRLTSSFIRQLAMIVTMQPPAEILGFEPYTFEEMVAFALTLREAWPHVMLWSRGVLAGAVESLPNEVGARTAA